MLTKSIGGIFLVLSSIVMVIILFLYLNSSAYLTYNTETESLSQIGLIIPLLLAIVFFVFGVLLVQDRELDSH